ncbi:MAG: insulinase family protein [Clostridia bacterium]|nr:insulinase family protein [Clostridia bacterium]
MVYEKKYANGLRLVVKKMAGLYSVTMGILVGTGACVETDEEDGISHFIEHMQFKVTKKRSAFEISDAFDRIGAQVNAFTGKDMTCYYSKSTSDHTAEAFEVLADLFLNATYPEEEIVREKGVICEEISMNEDTPEDLCLDLLATASFGKNNYGRNILGTQKKVNAFTLDMVERYKSERYCPENIVIAFAGDIDFATADALVESYFGTLAAGNFKKREFTVLRQKKTLTKKKPIEQLHLAVGYPAPERDHKLSDALQTMNSILGGSMSSRLFQEVREKKGLAYSVYSYLSGYEECGSLNIYAGINPTKLEEAYGAIEEVIRDLKTNGVSEEEFIRGREQMKASMLFAQESTSSQMLLYGKYMLYNGETYDFEERYKKMNEMRRSDVLDALTLTFELDARSVAIVGNIGKKPKFL